MKTAAASLRDIKGWLSLNLPGLVIRGDRKRTVMVPSKRTAVRVF